MFPRSCCSTTDSNLIWLITWLSTNTMQIHGSTDRLNTNVGLWWHYNTSMTDTKWIHVIWLKQTPSQPREKAMNDFKIYPGYLSRLPQSTILTMWLQWYEVEHGRNHLITDQWCELLTSAGEITIDFNDSQCTLVQSPECEWMIWCWTLSQVYWSKVNDVNLCWERENLSLRHMDLKVLNLFLRLIPGWWADVDMNSLVEGGPWWNPHQ